MEYQKRCRTCGKIFCYTDGDIAENKSNRTIAILSSIGTIGNAVAGTNYDAYEQNKMADKAMSKITDFDKCPYCNSRDVYLMDENEIKSLKREELAKSVNISGDVNPDSLLKRASLFLEDQEWEMASAYAENALVRDPENPYGYLYKLMADKEVSNIDGLKDLELPFFENADYKKAFRFADDNLKTQLQDAVYFYSTNKMAAAKTYEDYMAAADLLEDANYKDSPELSSKCKALAEEIKLGNIYNSALTLMESGKKEDYMKAIETFKTISDFKDSKEQIRKCEEFISDIDEKEILAREEAAIKAKKDKKALSIIIPIVIVVAALVFLFVNVIMPSSKYKSALNAMEEGDYISAYESLKGLGDYKDSKEKMITAKSLAFGVDFEALYKASVGEIVEFGNYEQDNNSANGAETIRWIVLKKEDNKLLLISESILDAKTFNNKKDNDVTWETSSLRSWLNDDFYNTAFTEDIQSFILSTDVYTKGNDRFISTSGVVSNYGENSTTDKVFLLSLEEAENYYSSKTLQKASFTDYAKARKLFLTDGNAYWWLRTNGFGTSRVCFVYNNDVDFHGGEVCYRENGVRPVIWVSLEP